MLKLVEILESYATLKFRYFLLKFRHRFLANTLEFRHRTSTALQGIIMGQIFPWSLEITLFQVIFLFIPWSNSHFHFNQFTDWLAVHGMWLATSFSVLELSIMWIFKRVVGNTFSWYRWFGANNWVFYS